MKTAPGAYALRGCWKLFFDNKDIYFEQPHRVFWHKDGYYDWNECIKRKANMEDFKTPIQRYVGNIFTRIRNRDFTPSSEYLVQTNEADFPPNSKCYYETVWNVPTLYGQVLLHVRKNTISKKDILNEIRKRKRHFTSLVVTRKIGILGFEVSSYI